MPRYEFQIGFYIDADTYADAFKEAERAIEVMNAFDAEDDAALEYCGWIRDPDVEPRTVPPMEDNRTEHDRTL